MVNISVNAGQDLKKQNNSNCQNWKSSTFDWLNSNRNLEHFNFGRCQIKSEFKRQERQR
jgi:hypothetical protein